MAAPTTPVARSTLLPRTLPGAPHYLAPVVPIAIARRSSNGAGARHTLRHKSAVPSHLWKNLMRMLGKSLGDKDCHLRCNETVAGAHKVGSRALPLLFPHSPACHHPWYKRTPYYPLWVVEVNTLSLYSLGSGPCGRGRRGAARARSTAEAVRSNAERRGRVASLGEGSSGWGGRSREGTPPPPPRFSLPPPPSP